MSQQKPTNCGSLNILFDLYLDAESNCGVAFSPHALDSLLKKTIAEIGMVRRTGMLDVWKTKYSGPASSFHSLEESHVRVETWPEDRHVQGEVQLCNFSRDNREATMQYARLIIERLKPASAHLLCIPRGPGPRPFVSQSIDWKRGEQILF